MRKDKSVTLLNAGSNLLLQLVTIASGFVIPRIILTNFGSEVNGLVSSLTQFLNYISLLEGGVSAVIMASLYGPLAKKDHKKLSSVVATAEKFFKKISYAFIAYALIISLGYPLISGSSFSFGYVAALALILAITIFMRYSFSFTWMNLLNAGKKVYIVSLVQILVIVLNTVCFAVLSRFVKDIHILELSSAAIYLLQPILYRFYARKHFPVEKNAPENKALLKSRWDGFGINIAAFIHYNADVTVLTVFADLVTVSVYSVYALVTTGLRKVIFSISSGIVPSMGHIYASGDRKELLKSFRHYEFVIYFLTFFAFTVGGLLITPFVKLYTSGVTDVDYFRPAFGILLILAEGVCCLREPYVNLAYTANAFKDIKKYAYVEAILNIGISIALVIPFGIVGVAIGTLAAMLYRTIFHVVYLKKILPEYHFRDFVKVLGTFAVSAAVSIGICLLIPMDAGTVSGWLLTAVVYSLVTVGVQMTMCAILMRDELKYAAAMFRRAKS